MAHCRQRHTRVYTLVMLPMLVLYGIIFCVLYSDGFYPDQLSFWILAQNIMLGRIYLILYFYWLIDKALFIKSSNIAASDHVLAISHFCFGFSLFSLSVLGLSFVLTRGFNHVGNSRTDGPRGTSLTDTLSQSNNLQPPKGLVWLPLQVCIPAASSAPDLVLTWPCRELIQLTGWTESTKEQSEYFLATLAIWKCLREVSGQAQAEGEGQDKVAGPRRGQERAALFFLAGVSCVRDWLSQLI